MTTKPKPQAATFFDRPLRMAKYMPECLELSESGYSVFLQRYRDPPTWRAQWYGWKSVSGSACYPNPHTALRKLEAATRELLAELRELVDEED